MGYLYAVEAAAAGGVVLVLYGLATHTLTRAPFCAKCCATRWRSQALFALLVGATVFTLILRAYGTGRWVAAALCSPSRGRRPPSPSLLASLALCALVLDAFEMIFVVIPIVMPPLLTQIGDATWVAVLTLLILQASFLTPPFRVCSTDGAQQRASGLSRARTGPLALRPIWQRNLPCSR